MSKTLLAALLSASLLGCASHPTVRPDDVLTDANGSPPEQPTPPRLARVVVAPPSRVSTGVISRVDLIPFLDAAPGRFLQHVQPEPRFAGGRFHGWRLLTFFPGDPRFAGVDLQAGDVVLTVNGQSVEQPNQLMRVWDSLRTSNLLVVSYEREGQARELRFEIR
jgi:S1-C subfamily serine protease